MFKKKKPDNAITEVEILQLDEGRLQAFVVGTRPLIYNAMSEKAWHELMMPRGRLNAADKAANLKHEPFEEYRNSVYLDRDPKGPTALSLPAVNFKKAVCCAALDHPGAAKAQIGRLTWVPTERVSIYGVPQIFSTIVRLKDGTPDVRTRAIVPEWCAAFVVAFMEPLLKEQMIANLIALAGRVNGVGDFRQQKGGGSYGQFRMVNADDRDYARIVKTGGRKAQLDALANPVAFDEETERLLAWFTGEMKRRGSSKNGHAVKEELTTEA